LQRKGRQTGAPSTSIRHVHSPAYYSPSLSAKLV
jgi:hypothetical protein